MNFGLLHADILQRELLQRVISSVPGWQVVWAAASRAEALDCNARQSAQLVLLELSSVQDEAVESIRVFTTGTPSAVLLVSDNIHTHAASVFNALGQGAMDAVELPHNATSEVVACLLGKLHTIANLLGHSSARSEARAKEASLIAIGASAGGPAALAQILTALPASLSASIVIVQHVDTRFAAGMAAWLAQSSRLPVRIACEGEPPAVGEALIAGSAGHLVLDARQRLAYVLEPSHASNRPSVDVLFESIAQYSRQRVIGVLLTGMGQDGARGLRLLRDRGHHTIAQDAASSAIYGMPKEAVRLDAAAEILPLHEIAARLTHLLSLKEFRS